jgi:hypothetical protein
MPRMRASGSWRTSQRGLGALHHVTRLVVRAGRREQFALPWEDVADFERSAVVLRRAAEGGNNNS